MISSAMPSLKYSNSGSPLRFANGKTAIDSPPSPSVVASSRAVRAAANWAAVANRSAGALASAVNTARSSASVTVGRTLRIGGAMSTEWRAITACAVRPVNGTDPVSISYTTHARL